MMLNATRSVAKPAPNPRLTSLIDASYSKRTPTRDQLPKYTYRRSRHDIARRGPSGRQPHDANVIPEF
jgi:hypothetical protein